MRSAPPIAPGMPRRNSSPATPASRAARATTHVGHRGAGAHAMAVLDLDLPKPRAEPHHDARDAAVAHDEVRADAEHRHRNVGGQVLQEIGEVVPRRPA